MPQIGWIFDKSKCVGCRACVVACKMENNTGPDLSYRWVIERESGHYPAPRLSFVSMGCYHCAQPSCLEACPTGSISKDPATGAVQIDQETCVGCRYCLAVCPYGAPQYNVESGKAEKCTYCQRRLEEGLEPACAATCVGGAITAATDEAWGGTPPDDFASPNLTGPAVKFEE